MTQTIAGRRWQRLQETLTEAQIPYTRDGSQAVTVAHPSGIGAGHLVIRVSHSRNADVRARSIGPESGQLLDFGRVLWALSLTLEELPAVALEYVRTGGQP